MQSTMDQSQGPVPERCISVGLILWECSGMFALSDLCVHELTLRLVLPLFHIQLSISSSKAPSGLLRYAS